MKKYKVVHLMWNNDTNLKFYPALIELINSNFNEKDQLFVTPCKSVYDALHNKYDNIELFATWGKRSGRIVRYCLRKGQCVILHGLCSPVLLLKPWDYKRIIWRTWGGDVHYTYKKGEIIKNTAKKALELCKKIVVKQFYAVGIANTVDEIDIMQTFGNTKTMRINYPIKKIDELLKITDGFLKDENYINILVGHSGFPNDRHLFVLKSLERFKNENIQIHMILSYGDTKYIESIENYVRLNWPTKVIIHKDFMQYGDYINFLSTMHIAIFDATTSYALGNISWLIEMKKTLIVNSNGVIRKAFDKDNVPYICSDKLESISYEELIRKRDYSKMKDGMKILTYRQEVENWKSCIQELDEVSHHKKCGGGHQLVIFVVRLLYIRRRPENV